MHVRQRVCSCAQAVVRAWRITATAVGWERGGGGGAKLLLHRDKRNRLRTGLNHHVSHATGPACVSGCGAWSYWVHTASLDCAVTHAPVWFGRHRWAPPPPRGTAAPTSSARKSRRSAFAASLDMRMASRIVAATAQPPTGDAAAAAAFAPYPPANPTLAECANGLRYAVAACSTRGWLAWSPAVACAITPHQHCIVGKDAA
jgi:hypothetical protein